MLWSKAIGAGGTLGGVPIEFVGGVGYGAERSNRFENSSRLDVLGIADVGDLVVISVSGRANSNNTWSWAGMNFTDIARGIGSDPFYYVGYHFVEAGDTNPYVTGADWIAFAVTATVFRQVSSFDASTAVNTSFPLNTGTLNSTSRLWMVVGGKYASAALLSTPTSYNIGASQSYDGSFGNDASSSQFYKIQSLSSDTPVFPNSEASAWAMAIAFS